MSARGPAPESAGISTTDARGRVRAGAWSHTGLRRSPHPPAGVARSPRWNAARSADCRRGRHRRSHLPPMTTPTPRRGRLKIFLGYAAGVGKTYQMLTEARELKARGVDVVGYFESHSRNETIALTEGVQVIPRNSHRVSRRR